MAILFDAAGEMLYTTTGVPDSNLPYTVACWHKPTVRVHNVGVLYNFSTGSSTNRDSLEYWTSYLAYLLYVRVGAGGPSQPASPLITQDQWYYIAAVRESATSIRTYIDCVAAVQSTLDVSGRGANNRLDIGNQVASSAPTPAGPMAYCRIWSAALTPGELEEEMYSATPVRTANLWADYRFENGALTTDSSGNGRTLTQGGTPTWIADPTLPTPSTGVAPLSLFRRRGLRRNMGI